MVSLGPKRLLKAQVFGKKANFPVEIKFWLIYSRIFDCDKPQGTICMGPRGNLTNNCGSSKMPSVTPRCCWKLKFLKKKVILSSEEMTLAFIFSYFRL